MTESGVTTSASAFDALGPAVRRALAARGFDEPTEPQARAIPTLANGQDALVIAPTGTGKTETAMLPVLNAIVEAEPKEGFSALYITPLRALNRDMRQRLDWWGEKLDVRVDVRHGDTSQYRRGKQADNPPDVLVTTPETLQAMLTGKKLRKGLAAVEHVIIDEVHELAAAKRGAQLTIGLEHLREIAGSFQRIGLSATVGDPEEVGRFLTGGHDCSIIEVDIASKVSFEVVDPEPTDEDEKLAGELMTTTPIASHVRTILDIVESHDSTLIFVNTRQTAEALGSRFKKLEANIGVHHGSLSKDARIEVEDQFKAGKLDALLCTSSMELGIDVGRIDHVVQYASPREVARLLQRVGRAGHRMDEVSEGTIITTHADDTMEALAIARRAKAGLVEPADIHDGSLDTVANQIVGLVMGFGDVSAMAAYRVVTRAYPFRDLSEEAFKNVVRELAKNRIIWLDEEVDSISKTGQTWQYFYANLSMIPDEETFEVVDMAAGRQVGTLDERFVVNFAEPGEVFIQRGEMWRIVEIDDEKSRVNVSPIEDPGGEVPSWVGEEIPVPFAVAQEVGEIRAVAGPQFKGGATRKAVGRELLSRYPTDERTVETALDHLEKHAETETPFPTADQILVEGQSRTVVINVCAGHKVNETLGRLVSSLLGQRTGSSVGMDIDPYRVSLEIPPQVGPRDVREVLESTEPAHVGPLIELSMKHSDTLKFRLAQVAVKFGAIKNWQGTKGNRFSRGRFLDALAETPMYDEAVREVFHDDLAVEDAEQLLEAIQSGDVSVEITGGRTPVGIEGRSSGKELLAPENADASVIETIKERIQEDRVILHCVHCAEWKRKTKVGRVSEKPVCPQCGSTRIAALKPWEDDIVKAVRATEKNDEQVKLTKKAHRSASLVQAHGRRAVIALAARGVGPRNTALIINKLRENEADFYRDILERERAYARTKSFWD